MDNLLNYLRNPGNLSFDKKKILVVAVFSLAIIYLDLSFFMKFQIKNISSLTPKITQLNRDIATLKKDLIDMQQTKVKQQALLKTQEIVSEGEIPKLLQSISNISNKYNVKITQMMPSRELDIKGDAALRSAARLIPVLITLDLFCDYHRLGRFINDIENGREFMAVEEIKIVRDANSYLNQNINLVLRTYVRK